MDIYIPGELHNYFSDLCPFPENIACPDLKAFREKGIFQAEKVKKLTPNLHNKKKYIIHYKLLEHFLSLGTKLVHIHRVLYFTEEPWMKDYIAFNTDMRIKAVREGNAFGKEFYKLLNNSVYGKTMENVRERMNLKIVTSSQEDKILRNMAKPTYKGLHVFNPTLAGVLFHKTTVTLDKPIFTGVAVLDLSKQLMYEFWYLYLKKKYPNEGQLVLNYTDTDSLIFTVKTDDLYEDMRKDKFHFDLSCYPGDFKTLSGNQMRDGENELVIGKMKDERPRTTISEFIGLRSKAYCVISPDSIIKKGKGIPRGNVEKDLNADSYRNALFQGEVKSHCFTKMQSKNHNIIVIDQTKKGLSNDDNKRQILRNKVDTLPWGHLEGVTLSFY